MKNGLENKAHLITLLVGLLNVAVLPLWRLPIPKATAEATGYPLFGLGLALNLLSLLALKRGFGGEIEPVTELVTSGIYAWLRHPMYVSFAITVLGLDVLMRSALGVLVTLFAFLPSRPGGHAWRKRPWPGASARRGRSTRKACPLCCSGTSGGISDEEDNSVHFADNGTGGNLVHLCHQ